MSSRSISRHEVFGVGSVAGPLGQEIARQLIELSVYEQAKDWPDKDLGVCPLYGGTARKTADQPRVLATTRGGVERKQPIANCPRFRRAFFPHNLALCFDRCGFSPRVQQKFVHAGVNGTSYQQALRDLAELSDLKIAPKPVERMTRKIGRGRNDQRETAVRLHLQLPLKDHVVTNEPKRVRWLEMHKLRSAPRVLGPSCAPRAHSE